MRPINDTTAVEVVYLLAELRCAGTGPVLEIGSRARVIASNEDQVTLAVEHGGVENVVTCARTLVARKDQALTRRRTLRRTSHPAF